VLIDAAMKAGLALAFAVLLSACSSAGPYGHSQVYSPLDEEETAAKGAVDFDPVMAKRSPDQWKGKTVSLFGIVVARSPGTAGNAEVKLSVRTLDTRNLCDSSDEDTCRVTVSDREHAVVHALLHLATEDDIGEHSLGPQSLVRIVGTLSDGVDPSDGEPILVAKYYRHWPRGFYVTTAARSLMRQ
jgi:hypothetical protein